MLEDNMIQMEDRWI